MKKLKFFSFIGLSNFTLPQFFILVIKSLIKAPENRMRIPVEDLFASFDLFKKFFK